MLGFFFAEIGSWLTEDYYQYRRNRNQEGSVETLTEKIHPPQLVLKGAWGAYLVALLFTLVAAILMAERGWVILLFAFGGFFSSYYAGAEPFHLNQFSLGKLISTLASTWIPFFSASYICGTFPREGTYFIVLITYLLFAGSNIGTNKSQSKIHFP